MASDHNDSKRTRPRSKLVRALLVMIVLLIGVLFYLIYDKDRLTERLTHTKEELSDELRQKDALEIALENEVTQLKYLQEEYEAIGEENTEIQSLITSMMGELDEWRNKSQDDNKAKMLLMVKLKRSMTENRQLTKEFNDELQVLKLKVASLEDKNQFLSLSNDSLNATVQDQSHANRRLSAQLKKVKPKNVTLYAISDHGKVSRKSPFRQKLTRTMVLQLELENNEFAQQEDKTYYLRITDPKGAILYDPKKEGLSFNLENGNQFYYSSMVTQKFMNSNDQVELSYSTMEPFQRGDYQLECYVDGYLISSTDFKIK